MYSEQPVFRFAPSPNGELHLGHAYSALLNFELAREAGGKILLRIEDIDTARCTPQLEKQMLKDLEWIGFEWDEPPIRQSDRFDSYRTALLELETRGLVYPSSMSRSEIKRKVSILEERGDPWPRDPDGSPLYPGHERETPLEERPKLEAVLGLQVIRLDMKAAKRLVSDEISWIEDGYGPGGETGLVTANPERWGDVVLARRDTPTSYHLACVLDDADQGVTNIVRGADLFHATSVHRVLQLLFELPQPKYHHHDLLMENKLRKLSKSKQDTSLRELRETGMTRQAVRELVGFG